MTNVTNPNIFGIATGKSPIWKVSSGMVAKLSDASGAQTIIVARGGKLDLDGASGSNTIVFEGLSFADVDVYRDGTEARIRLLVSGETIASIPVVTDAQVLRFTDGEKVLQIVSGVPKLAGATIAADTAAPTLLSAELSGKSLVMKFSEELNAANLPAASALTIKVNGTPLNSTAYTLSGVEGKNLLVTLSNAVATGAAVTVAYTDPTAVNDTKALQDVNGNDVTTFADFAVSNVVALTDVSAPVVSVHPPYTAPVNPH